MIDYARMQRVFPKQKAALTRAKKKGYKAIEDVCRAAVREWNEIGAWPDQWSLFQRTLDDAAFAMRAGENVNAAPRLEDLEVSGA